MSAKNVGSPPWCTLWLSLSKDATTCPMRMGVEAKSCNRDHTVAIVITRSP